MTRIRRIVLFVLIFGPALVASAQARNCSVLLDISGSMRGFADAPDGHFRTFLSSLTELCPDLYVFGDIDPQDSKATVGPGLLRWTLPIDQLRFDNGTTLLGTAAQKWSDHASDGDAAIIVTDNVADIKSERSKVEQKTFNAEVTRAKISRFTALPAVLPFSGTLFHPTDPGRRYKDYDETRALAVYVMQVNGDADIFRALADDAQRSLAAAAVRADRIDVRPLAEALSPNFRFGSLHGDNKSTRISPVTDAVGTLKAIRVSRHPVDEEVTISLDFDVRAQGNWNVDNVQVVIEFAPSKSDAFGARLTKRVTTVTHYPHSLSLHGGLPQTVHVDVKLNARNYYANTDWWNVIKNIALGDWSGTETANIRVRLDLSSAMPKVDRTFSDKWSFEGSVDDLVIPKPAIQDQVYRLSPVLEEQVAGPHSLTLPSSIVLNIEYLYPRWPFFAFLCFVLIVGGTLAGLLWFSKGAKRYLVESDGAEGVNVSLAWFSSTMLQSGDGEVRLFVRRLPLVLWSSSTKRIVRGRVLPQGGGLISLSSSAGSRLGDLLGSWRRRSGGARRGAYDPDSDPYTDVRNTGRGIRWNFRIRALGGENSEVNRHEYDDI